MSTLCRLNVLFVSEANKSYEMSSFSENAAMNLLKDTPVEFVKYLFNSHSLYKVAFLICVH